MRIAWVLMSLGWAASLVLVLLQLGPLLAYRRLHDPGWRRHASAVELRDTAHEALALRFGDPHDTFGVLQEYGDRSSIPHLEAALARRLGPTGEVFACTDAHGLDALARARSLPC
jgi:hypothetical protein